MALSLTVSAGPSARIGTAFSDTYAAMAPLVMLHRSYADYLFYGTEVEIPQGLWSACEGTGLALGLMHIELLSQTGSHVVDTLSRLSRLRSDVAVLCSVYSETLDTISRMSDPDMDVLDDASQLGLFSNIYELQQGFQFTLDAYLEGIPSEQATWEFAAAFSMRTLLTQHQLVLVDRSVQAILYGSEDAMQPPAFVPADIADAIRTIVGFIDTPIDSTTADELRDLVELIFTYAMERP